MLKHKTSECSSDTITTNIDTAASDPLSSFLLSLLPI